MGRDADLGWGNSNFSEKLENQQRPEGGEKGNNLEVVDRVFQEER